MESPVRRNIGWWLLSQEMGDREDPDALVEAAERVCRKLSRQLATLVTVEGSRALVGRSLVLTRSEFPFLAAVRHADGGESAWAG